MTPPLEQFVSEYFILDRTPPHKRRYLHVGSYDGKHGDCTAYLQSAGWLGVLVEPNPAIIPHLLMNRADANTVIFDVACVANETERQASYIGYAELGQHGGLSPDHSKIESEARRYPNGVTPNVSIVKAMTVNEILRVAFDGKPHALDYVQIDTEGTEQDVLAGFDLDLYTPALMCIETDDPRNADMDMILMGRGYDVIARYGQNTVYERVANAT